MRTVVFIYLLLNCEASTRYLEIFYKLDAQSCKKFYSHEQLMKKWNEPILAVYLLIYDNLTGVISICC